MAISFFSTLASKTKSLVSKATTYVSEAYKGLDIVAAGRLPGGLTREEGTYLKRKATVIASQDKQAISATKSYTERQETQQKYEEKSKAIVTKGTGVLSVEQAKTQTEVPIKEEKVQRSAELSALNTTKSLRKATEAQKVQQDILEEAGEQGITQEQIEAGVMKPRTYEEGTGLLNQISQGLGLDTITGKAMVGGYGLFLLAAAGVAAYVVFKKR